MVRTIPVPEEVAQFAALDPVGYGEAFAFETDKVLTPEAWARLILEGAPPAKRASMLGGWKALGIRLAPLDADGQVLGWRIRQSGPRAIVLETQSVIGLTARIVLLVRPGQVVHAMVVRFDRITARPVWAVVAPRHRRFVQALLGEAQRRAAATAAPR